MSNMLNTVQHTNTIKKILRISKKRNQTVLKYSVKHSCVTKLSILFHFSPQKC